MKVALTRRQVIELIQATGYAMEMALVEGGEWERKPKREIAILTRALRKLSMALSRGDGSRESRESGSLESPNDS